MTIISVEITVRRWGAAVWIDEIRPISRIRPDRIPVVPEVACGNTTRRTSDSNWSSRTVHVWGSVIVLIRHSGKRCQCITNRIVVVDNA